MAMAELHPIDHAMGQLRGFGLQVDELRLGPYPDETVPRVRHREDRAGTKNGWYVAYSVSTRSGRDVIVGVYGWWKAGDTAHKLKIDGAGLSIDDQRAIEDQRRQIEQAHTAARAKVAEEAATRAARIWPGLPEEGASPYLDRKQVRAFGIRFARGSVVVPLTDGARLVGLQWIDASGAKRFLTGTSKKGAWHGLGAPPGPGEVCAIAEGYATAASVHQALGWYVAVAFDAGNLGAVAKAHQQRYPGARLVLLADDDHRTAGNPGVTKATAAARAVRGVLAVPRFVDSSPARGTDWNDLAVTEGAAVVRAQLASLDLAAPPPPPPSATVVQGDFPHREWQGRLQRTEKGHLRATAFNLRLILENDPAWKGVLGWCEFSARLWKRQPPPYPNASRGEWDDADDADLRFWSAERYGIEPKGQDLADAVQGAARASPFHPVREYLDGLAWDGVARLDTWLRVYLGAQSVESACASTPTELQVARTRVERYLARVGAMALIQAVARVRDPGCKADSVLILEGEQGLLKSTALRTLFGVLWFSDTPIDIGSKDAYEAIRGLWAVEMAELDSLNKADATRAKAFFSSAVDRFRMPYGHRAQQFKRQCVICGTTNQHQYLKDQTGNRRYWPVACTDIDIPSLLEMRDQIWAEADHRYRAGEPWWPQAEDRALFAHEQQDRTDGDVWESLIQTYLHDRLRVTPPEARATLFVTAAEVMAEALKMDAGAMRRPEQTRVGIILQALGWRSRRPLTAAGRVRGYRPGLDAIRALSSAPGGDDVPLF